jgi:hypothetical protein
MNFRALLLAVAMPFAAGAQIALNSIDTTDNQAVIGYIAPDATACTIQAADMNRNITAASSSAAAGVVTITTALPHGLLSGSTVYLDGAPSGNQWQQITVTDSTHFTFTSGVSSSITGNVGILVPDVDTALYSGSNLDTRTGTVTAFKNRIFVLGAHSAPISADGLTRYSRALQIDSRHHLTITCGASTLDAEFYTQNIAGGNTYNIGPTTDPANPGQYEYPTIQWSNTAQQLNDPVTGVRMRRGTQPSGIASSTTTFNAAFDIAAAWTNPTGPLTSGGGAATFTSPCASGSSPTCPLYVGPGNSFQLDTLSGGNYANDGGSSLDWMQVTLNGAFLTSSATGDDAKEELCLTADGVTCAIGSKTNEVTLTTSPANTTVGTQNLMDVWQTAGWTPPVNKVDASFASGTANYTLATKTLIVPSVTTALSGAKAFNLKWGFNSRITVAGTVYLIDHMVDTQTLVLQSGPGSNLTGASWSANNFGVLIWKKTATANTVNLGQVTFTYGSSTYSNLTDQPIRPCSDVASTVNGVQGYLCVIGSQANNTAIYWISADGTIVNPLGNPTTNGGRSDQPYVTTLTIASNKLQPWSPTDPDTWYFFYPSAYNFAFTLSQALTIQTGPIAFTAPTGMAPQIGALAPIVLCPTSLGSCPQSQEMVGTVTAYNSTTGAMSAQIYQIRGSGSSSSWSVKFGRPVIIKATYSGDHTHGTPSQTIPECSYPGHTNPPPCVTYTVLNPGLGQDLYSLAAAINPVFDITTSDFYQDSANWGAVHPGDSLSPNGYININWWGHVNVPNQTAASQNALTAIAIVEFGDGTAYGTGTGFNVIAATDTWSHAPCRWCGLHSTEPQTTGHVYGFSAQNNNAAAQAFTLTFTPALNATNGIAGGLNSCPVGGGTNCTELTISTNAPANSLGNTLQNIAVGDYMQMANTSDGCFELFQIVQINSHTDIWIKRAVVGGDTFATSACTHSTLSLQMICGLSDAHGNSQLIWDFIADPTGTSGSTSMSVFQGNGGHNYVDPTGTYAVFSALSYDNPNCANAPAGVTGGKCYVINFGANAAALTTAANNYMAMNAPFGGWGGIGTNNTVDTHPGPCASGVCVDGRPYDGDDGSAGGLGTQSAPFANVTVGVTGPNLWKISDSTGILKRKIMPTLAAVGPYVLLDISGPGSLIDGDTAHAYMYCVAYAAGECFAGSAAGDVYFNAPYTMLGYCWYAGIGGFEDNVIRPCFGNIGANTGSGVLFNAFGNGGQDNSGAWVRRLGPSLNRWNRQDPFWLLGMPISQAFALSLGRWLDNTRTDILIQFLPPIRQPDSYSRNSFVAVPIPIPQPFFNNVATATLEFGNGEWQHDPANFYCTSRNEACVATGSAINLSNPFSYRATDTYTRAACSSGCTITVPSIPNSVLYYRWKYFDSGGALIATGPTYVKAVP